MEEKTRLGQTTTAGGQWTYGSAMAGSPERVERLSGIPEKADWFRTPLGRDASAGTF